MGGIANPFETDLVTGIIAMWHGALSSIPTGWVLCDGTGGTPDLRARFIQGAAPGIDPGAVGGATNKTTAGHLHSQPGHLHSQPTHLHTTAAIAITENQMPAHTHNIVGDMNEQGGSSYIKFNNLSGNNLATGSKGGGATHAHGNTGSGGNQNTGSAGGDNTGNNTDSIADIRPIFYDLAFIMKT